MQEETDRTFGRNIWRSVALKTFGTLSVLVISCVLNRFYGRACDVHFSETGSKERLNDWMAGSDMEPDFLGSFVSERMEGHCIPSITRFMAIFRLVMSSLLGYEHLLY